jgi:hypothetical protein
MGNMMSPFELKETKDVEGQHDEEVEVQRKMKEDINMELRKCCASTGNTSQQACEKNMSDWERETESISKRGRRVEDRSLLGRRGRQIWTTLSQKKFKKHGPQQTMGPLHNEHREKGKNQPRTDHTDVRS